MSEESEVVDQEDQEMEDKQAFIKGWKAGKLDTIVKVLERSIEAKMETPILPSSAEILLPVLKEYLQDSPHCEPNTTIVHTHWRVASAGVEFKGLAEEEKD